MVKPGAFLSLLALCAWAGGCANPTTPSDGANYQGRWSGTTAQGSPIAFTVSADQKVTAITIGYSFNGCSGAQTFSNLSLATSPDVTCIPGPCSPSVTSFRAFGYTTSSPDGSRTTLNGGFPTPGRAQGVVGFTDYPGCGTALGVSWSASR